MSKISVFLADWQVLFREGVHFTLSGEEDFEVIGEGTTAEEVLAFIETNLPEVAVLNINHGKLSGAEATRRIKKNLPSVSVILTMDNDNEEKLFSAIKSGASACLSKDTDPEDLVNIIRKVAEGSYPISEALLRPGITSRIIDEFEASLVIGEQLNNLLAHLAPREGEIMRHIADGGSEEQVCQALDISEETMRQHLELIRTKLVANNYSRELIQAVQAHLLLIPQAKVGGLPTTEHVTKEEFSAFKESLREHLKSFMGE